MAAMTNTQQSLVKRVRDLLDPAVPVREVSMFGGRAIMANDKMIVSVGKDGSLLVRVDANDHDRLLQQPGASQAEMGAGRSMGPGWITIAPEHLTTDQALGAWIEEAMIYNRTTTARP